jgi:hypothetical protein
MTQPLSLQARGLYVPYYEYFAIKDQSSVVWYWWVTASRDLAWGLSPGVYVHRQSRAVVLSPIPYWLVLVDGTAVARYVYPRTLTGEILIMPSAPAVGSGYTGSPLVLTMATPHYGTLGANPLQEATTNVS